MPFDVAGNFSRLHNWQDDRDAGIRILADRHDAEDDNFALGFNQTFLRTGAAPMTGDLNMNGNGIHTIEAGSAAVPGLTFELDVDTGLFQPAPDQLGVSVSGLQTALFTSASLNLIGKLAINAPTDIPSNFFLLGATAGIRMGSALDTATIDATDETGSAAFKAMSVNALGFSVSTGAAPQPALAINNQGEFGFNTLPVAGVIARFAYRGYDDVGMEIFRSSAVELGIHTFDRAGAAYRAIRHLAASHAWNIGGTPIMSLSDTGLLTTVGLVLIDAPADGNSLFRVLGVTAGLRIGTAPGIATIDAVDETGGVSYKPLSINATTISLAIEGTTKLLVNAAGAVVAGSGTINGSLLVDAPADGNNILRVLGATAGLRMGSSAGGIATIDAVDETGGLSYKSLDIVAASYDLKIGPTPATVIAIDINKLIGFNCAPTAGAIARFQNFNNNDAGLEIRRTAADIMSLMSYNRQAGAYTKLNYYGLTHAWHIGGVETMSLIQPSSQGILLLNRTAYAIGGGNGGQLQIGDGLGSAGLTIHASATGSNDIQLSRGTTGTLSYNGMIRYEQSVNVLSFWTNATSRVRIADTNISPSVDATYNLGAATFRWATVYASVGTINTSDEREKTDICPIPDAWLDAWGAVQYSRYKWIKTSDSKVWHVGVIAQRIVATFKAAGIDALELGLVKYDAWEFRSETTIDGTVEIPNSAGDRWGVNYAECSIMEAAYQRREIARLKALLHA